GNPSFYHHFRVTASKTEGQLIYELGNGQWDVPELRSLLEKVLPEKKGFNDFEVAHQFQKLGHRVMLLNARSLEKSDLILLGIRDITDRKRWEDQLQELNRTLEERVEERTLQVRDLSATLTMAEQAER